MNVTNYNYGIKFSDLVDINNPYTTYQDVEDKINEVLTINCKKNYFIEDNELWNDFIKRFTTRYIFRTLSFDTYMNFFIKLNQVMLDNKLVLERMYETKMIEYNPLYTISKKIKDDETKNEITKNFEDNTENIIDKTSGTDTTKHIGEDTNKHRGYDTQLHQGTNTDKKTGYDVNDLDRTGTNSVVDNNYTLNSDAPRSTVQIADMFKTENNYITSGINNQNSRTETPNLNENSRTDYHSDLSHEYNESNDTHYFNDDVTVYNTDTSLTHGKNRDIDKTNNNKFDGNKDTSSQGNTFIEGYETNPIDNLKNYLDFVIDCNEYLLSEIDRNHLFMDIII